jgi:hypothetical protein
VVAAGEGARERPAGPERLAALACRAAAFPGCRRRRISKLQAQDHVQRAFVNSDGTIKSQNGSWLSADHDPANPGDYPFHFATGTFSSTPSCVVMAESGNQIPPTFECYSPSQAGMHCVVSSASAATGAVFGYLDTPMFVICVGPG